VVVYLQYNLVVDAIKLLYTGVSQPFLLKQDKFKDLRDRLLKTAAEFYGKLGVMPGKQIDVGSLWALLWPNDELAELTARVTRMNHALAAHWSVLVAHWALPPRPRAGASLTVEINQSYVAIAPLLHSTGRINEALRTYCETQALLSGITSKSSEARS
jgi:eukaryotic-like serine/threonine-protein kinase